MAIRWVHPIGPVPALQWLLEEAAPRQREKIRGALREMAPNLDYVAQDAFESLAMDDWWQVQAWRYNIDLNLALTKVSDLRFFYDDHGFIKPRELDSFTVYHNKF